MPTRPPLDFPRPPADADLPSLLEELAASGLSAAAFAREHGIPVWKLYRAKRAAGSGLRPRSRGPNSRLIPVRLVDSPGSAPPLELQLRSGLRLSIPSDFDEGSGGSRSACLGFTPMVG